MKRLILHYGLFGVLIGAVCEGDVTMILAGVVAHLGLLKLPQAVACGCLGGVIVDCTCYALARAQREWIARRPLYQRVKPVVDRMAKRVGAWEVMLARFVYGTRVASMFFWGIYGLSFSRFLLLDLIGCALWAAVLAGTGYAFSSSAELLIGKTKQVELWLLGALVTAGVVIFAARRLLRGRVLFRA